MTKFVKLTVLTLAGIISIYLTSCKKEPVYSCKEDVNNYVMKTMSYNQSISRDSLAKLGLDTQIAVFRSLLPVNKLRIFKEKVDLLMTDDSLSTDDKNHLKALKNYATEAIYDDAADESPDPYLVSWQGTAYNTLGWDSLKMYYLVETWLTLKELRGYYNLEIYYSTNSCVCNSRFACNLGFSDCNEGNCSVTKDGCGLFGGNPCKGTCAYFN